MIIFIFYSSSFPFLIFVFLFYFFSGGLLALYTATKESEGPCDLSKSLLALGNSDEKKYPSLFSLLSFPLPLLLFIIIIIYSYLSSVKLPLLMITLKLSMSGLIIWKG